MTSLPPKRNAAHRLYIGLPSQADTRLLQVNPTIALGDFQISIDGGSPTNLDTLPVVEPPGSRMVRIDLSAAEMDGDNVTIIGSDAAGAQWCDVLINLQTSTSHIDDLATSLSAIVADTNELQTDWTNGGRLDLLIDAILADTNELQLDWANGGRLDLLIDAIMADTGELQADWTNGGRLDLLIDAILADTNELQLDWANGGRLDLLLDSANAGGDATLANQTAMIATLASILADTDQLQQDWADGGRLDLLLDAIGAPPSAAAIVGAIMANDMEAGKTFAQLLIDLWAKSLGNSAANDATAPTSITYNSPDDTVQRTHSLTPTSRTVT